MILYCRLGKLEILAMKVMDQEEKVAVVEGKVKELEAICTSLPPAEAERRAQELRKEIAVKGGWAGGIR